MSYLNNSLKVIKLNNLIRYSSFGVRHNRYSQIEHKIKNYHIASYSTQSSRPPPCPTIDKCEDVPPPGRSITLKYLLIGLGVTLGAGVLGYYSGLFDKNEVRPKQKLSRNRKKVPATSNEIPAEVPYLLIGGGTASFSAFRAIKSHDPKAKVMVITNELEMPYMRPPLSKELWFNSDKNSTDILKFKQWNGVERSLFYEPDDFYVAPESLLSNENGGVTIVRGYTIKQIDVCEKKAILDDGTVINYDECLIATGSRPKTLDIFSNASANIQDKVSLFKTTEDYKNLRKIVSGIKSIAIVGGGFLGSELACALAKFDDTKNLKVYQLFYENGNMGKILPEYLSSWTTKRVCDEGVSVLPNSQIKSCERVGNQIKLALVDGRNLLVDHVIVAVGSLPNVDLAQASKLEVDNHFGGYVVNAELQARKHLYVAGDVACFYDPQLGRRRVEHHDHAVVSGRLAGENMVGLKKPYTHQSMFWSDLGPHVGYEAIGVIDSSLPTVGVFAKRTDQDVPSSSADNKLDGTSDIPKEIDDSKITLNTTVDGDDYGKGVVFYLKNDKIVGILLWNVFNRISVARKVIAENKKFDDLNEVAKLFDIHDQSTQ